MTKKAFVIDDDDDIRFMLRTLLRQQGWDVVEATDGTEAVERPAEPYDVVILDHRMPGMNGDEVAVRLREHYDGPVIFFSAYVTKELESSLIASVAGELFIVAKTDFDQLKRVVLELTAR